MGGAPGKIAGKVTSEQGFERRKRKITGETRERHSRSKKMACTKAQGGRSRGPPAIWFPWSLRCVKKQVEVLVGGDVEPVRKVLLAQQRGVHFIL